MLKWRLITAAILIPLVIGCLFYLPENIVKGVIGGVLILGLIEFRDLMQTSKVWSGITALVILFIYLLCAYSIINISFLNMSLLGVIFWIWASGNVLFFNGYDLTGWKTPIGRTLIGAALFLPAFICMTYLISLGPEWLLLPLSLVWAADSGAYFAGRYLGKTRLAPKVSPKKTWEGCLGGVIASALVFVSFYVFCESLHLIKMWHWIIFLPFAVMLSIFGDLFESMLKRLSGLKDSGKLLPGHGGILDRIDGVLAMIPFFTLFIF